MIRVFQAGAAFMQHTDVWCASAGSPHGAARRDRVRKALTVAALAPRRAQGRPFAR